MRRPVRILLGLALGTAIAALATVASMHALGLAATDESQIWLPSTPRGDLALAESDARRVVKIKIQHQNSLKITVIRPVN